MCELGLMTGERATGGLDGPDCSRADCESKCVLRVRLKHFLKKSNHNKKNGRRHTPVCVCVCVREML